MKGLLYKDLMTMWKTAKPFLLMIVIFCLTLLLLYFVKMGLNYFIQYEGHMMGVYMQARMRTDLFAHLETLPYSFFDSHETGKIMTRMTNTMNPDIGFRNAMMHMNISHHRIPISG